MTPSFPFSHPGMSALAQEEGEDETGVEEEERWGLEALFLVVEDEEKGVQSERWSPVELSSLSLLPAKVASSGERQTEEREDEDVQRKNLYCPS